jgi:hypothetical protein
MLFDFKKKKIIIKFNIFITYNFNLTINNLIIFYLVL